MTRRYQKAPQLRRLATATALVLVAGAAQAATRTDLHAQDVAKLNGQYKAATQGMTIAGANQRHAELLGMDAESALVQTHLLTDKDGTRHYRYQQTFRGIPVWGESIAVSEGKDGKVRSVFGQKVDRIGSEVAANAAASAMSHSRALSLGMSAGLGNKLGALKVERQDAKLMWYVNGKGQTKLAYVVTFFADAALGGSPTRPIVILDAHNGKLLQKIENLQHVLVGTGPGGNTKTGQYEWGSGGRYGYMDVAQSGTTCTMNNAGVKTVNLNGGTSGSTAFSYTCPRNTVKTINGGYSPLNDGHQFGGVITNMYPAYTGYNALSFQLVMKVHYSTNYENAFWNGTEMTFGDGATTFHPLVNADVSGHEVSHGFTEQHSNL
ncbi:MAG: peptidase M4 family protein, partial [Arenimonas sp.]